MPAPRCLILRTAGTNCDAETAHAFRLAGATADALHVNRLIESPGLLDDYQLLALPGGFSYGDDIAAGRIFALQLRSRLAGPMADFVAAGKPVIGICNGFQVLLKAGLLPGPLDGIDAAPGEQTCTLAANPSGRFVDRWVTLDPVPASRCVWTAGLTGPVELPVAHGEGRFVAGSDAVRAALWAGGHVALTYAAGGDASGPHDPNGSDDRIAGICDASGLVFGLMPHPERHVSRLQHPAWTSRPAAPDRSDEAVGLSVFRAAVARFD